MRLFIMPYIIALVGFIVLSGTGVPVSLPDNASATSTPGTVKVAIADEVQVDRPAKPESYMVKLTSYNAVPEQTDSNPSVTASGASSNHEVIAARSVDLATELPFGTIVSVEREAEDSSNCGYRKVEDLIGYRVIGDSMNSRITNTVDILFDQEDTVTIGERVMNPSRVMGLCHGVTVRVIGRISVKDIPDTQAELAKLVAGGKVAIR
ncbi:MAG: hypothetical protein ABA06_01180 [Parcubacteria bacterium C7867-001]|nr:MAG: hypothetical protein ABA06_01180 [Parcubacteria bacterium C7867-001]